MRLPAELRTIIFRHVCDTLNLRAGKNLELSGIPRLDLSRSGVVLLAVCRQINNEASMFVNDIYITRLESGALYTAERIPVHCQSIINNTLVLKMPMLAFRDLAWMIPDSPWYSHLWGGLCPWAAAVVQIPQGRGCGGVQGPVVFEQG